MPKTAPPRLVLASASPRRADLLAGVGLRFAVRPSHVDETPRAGETPAAMVERLAREKALAVSRPGELTLGADTTVVIDGESLGKPADEAAAAAMLRRLAGREHRVLTGVAIAEGPAVVSGVEVSRVAFAALDDEEIDWYVATGEPLDTAGAYAIQGRGGLLVTSIARPPAARLDRALSRAARGSTCNRAPDLSETDPQEARVASAGLSY
jgi:septum formation protein